MQKIIDFIKRVLIDPFGLQARWDSIKKSLDGIDIAKIILTAFSVISSGVTIDAVIQWLSDNSQSFGVYSGLVGAVVVVIVQIRRLYNQGFEKPSDETK